MFKFQKQRAIVGDGALEVKPVAKAAAVPKAVNQKKVTVKPKTENVIVISSEEEVKKVDKQLDKKKAVEGSSKKKGQTFTSTLTARSKVCIYSWLISVLNESLTVFFHLLVILNVIQHFVGCLRIN